MPSLGVRRARLWPVVLASSLAAAMLASVWMLAERAQLAIWREQLELVSDQQAQAFFRQAIRHHADGAELCVLALASPRPSIVAAAHETLYEETARWQLLPPDEAAARRHRLAIALADRIATFSPSGRRAASEMAALLLASPPGATSHERRDFTLACQQVLHAALAADAALPAEGAIASTADEPFRTVSWEIEPANSHDATSPSAEAHAAVALPRSSPSPIAAPATRLGDLTVKRDLAESVVRDQPASADIEAAPAEPRLLPSDMAEARPITGTPARLDALQDDTLPSNREAPRRLDPPRHAVPITSEAEPSHNAGGIESSLETMRLVPRLHQDAATAERARQELVRRGFSPLELELAQRLGDPNAVTRLRWLESLPGMPGIDVRPWLLWLSHDADAEVRLAALGMMATSSEPEMLRRVAEMAREEIEPRIQQQAARITERQQRLRR